MILNISNWFNMIYRANRLNESIWTIRDSTPEIEYNEFSTPQWKDEFLNTAKTLDTQKPRSSLEETHSACTLCLIGTIKEHEEYASSTSVHYVALFQS